VIHIITFLKKVIECMKGIPKGLCSFGGVQRQRLWSLFTAFKEQRNIPKALRKGEFQKQSGGLFLKEGRPASEGVP